jgi:hypothetical protein
MKLPTKKGKYLIKYYTSIPPSTGFRFSYKIYHTFFSYFDGKKFDKENVVEYQEVNWEVYT